jgi:hypothetical protein
VKAIVRKLHVADPPAAYLLRPPVVVDSSAICGILFDEPWLEKLAVAAQAHLASLP